MLTSPAPTRMLTAVLVIALAGCEGERRTVLYRDCSNWPSDQMTFVVTPRTQEVYWTSGTVTNLSRCAPDEPPSCRRYCVVADATHWKCHHSVDAADTLNHHEEWDYVSADGETLDMGEISTDRDEEHPFVVWCSHQAVSGLERIARMFSLRSETQPVAAAQSTVMNSAPRWLVWDMMIFGVLALVAMVGGHIRQRWENVKFRRAVEAVNADMQRRLAADYTEEDEEEDKILLAGVRRMAARQATDAERVEAGRVADEFERYITARRAGALMAPSKVTRRQSE